MAPHRHVVRSARGWLAGDGLGVGEGAALRERFGVIITGFITVCSRMFSGPFPVILRFTSGAQRQPEAFSGPPGKGPEPVPGLPSTPAQRGGEGWQEESMSHCGGGIHQKG